MSGTQRVYAILAIVLAAPALFTFCEPDGDLKTKVDSCANDYITSESSDSGGEGCTLTVHDSQCLTHNISISCDQADDLSGSPEETQSQSVNALKKQAGIQLGPRKTGERPSVTVSAGANILTQSLQHLLPYAVDLFSSSPAVASTVVCDPALNFYAIEHQLATVAHEFPCASGPYPRIRVATRPLQLAVTPDSAELWVTSYDNAISVISTSTDQVLATISAGGTTFPNGIAISPDGTKVYVTSFIDFAPALVTYNRATRTEMARLSIPTEYPQSVFLTPDGSIAVVTHALDNIVYFVDTLSNTIIGAHQIPQPYGVGFSPDGSTAYISSWPTSVVVMNLTNLTVAKTYTVGNGPIDVAVSSNGRWVTTPNNNDGTISTIDTASGTVSSTRVGGFPHGISLIN